MSKINKISGFPEWLPAEKMLEDKLVGQIRQIYESYGFIPIETPSVELVSSLQSKGVIDKEIYLLKRARQEDGEESDLALHFDLTVPFARYVAQHFSDLKFPFRRYQLQKVWRGERPQKGRFREFYQFDIDIIAINELPLSCDADVISAIGDVFVRLELGNFKIKINSRKILLGFYENLGLSAEQKKASITIVDKIDKIGKDNVLKELLQMGIAQQAASKIVELSQLKISPANLNSELDKLNINDPEFQSGKEELSTLLSLISKNAYNNLVIDLSMARGLDYYTGAIYEVTIDQYPEFGSVCSGGRYDDLASQFINKKLPGVGCSIGLTRLMELILSNQLLSTERPSPTKVLVAVYEESQRAACNQVAATLRELSIHTEVFYKSPKLGKQIDYALERAIPFVLFLNPENNTLEVKDLNSKLQVEVKDLKSWAKSLKI